MKIVTTLFVTIAISGSSLLAGDVKDSIQVVAAKILNRELPAIEVKKLETKISRQELVSELVQELMDAENPVTELVVNRMLLGMEPFPYQVIREQFTPEASSTKRAYLLFLLNTGASEPAQVDDVIELAKSLLRDTGKGTRRYGEARAYSADGLRVCDVAYNVLVARLELNPPMMPVNVDNYVVDERDALIHELAERASIQLTADIPSSATNTTSPQAPSHVQPSAPVNAPSTESTAAPSKEPTSSTPWSIIVVLIVAACGLLWLLLKRRL